MHNVLQDLSDLGFAPDSIELLNEVLQITEKADSNEAILEDLEERFKDIPEGTEGIEEMRYVLSHVEALGLAKAQLKLDINLARGLNYYTGAIFEVLPLTEHQVGSICGGGRYDDLTGIFGLKDMSGVGISFGADRIYDLLETMDLFPDSELQNTELMFVNFGEKEADFCHSVLSILRKEGVRGELYPDAAKMKKQMKYANDKNIPFVALVGENEMEQQAVTLKNMRTGDQDLVPLKELLSNLRNL
jgi:histidyl-tRNA synthetase